MSTNNQQEQELKRKLCQLVKNRVEASSHAEIDAKLSQQGDINDYYMSLLGIRGMETHVMGKKHPPSPNPKNLSPGAKRDLNNFEKPFPPSTPTLLPPHPTPPPPHPPAPRHHRTTHTPHPPPNPTHPQTYPQPNTQNPLTQRPQPNNTHPQDPRHSHPDNDPAQPPRYKRINFSL
jgi:hypothetical protein